MKRLDLIIPPDHLAGWPGVSTDCRPDRATSNTLRLLATEAVPLNEPPNELLKCLNEQNTCLQLVFSLGD